MILLTDVSHSLQLTTSSAANVQYQSSYVDMTTTSFGPLSTQGIISSATTTTIVSAPAASTQRQVKNISIKNTSSTLIVSVVVNKLVTATTYDVSPTVVLSPGESLLYSDVDGWKVYTNVGELKTAQAKTTALTTYLVQLFKAGTAASAAGVQYSFMKDTGYPAAIALGTPGVNGTIWAASTGSGHLQFQTPSSGSNYIRSVTMTASTAATLQLMDMLWYNTGLVVTTTTAQTFTTPTLPARDVNSSTAGVGIMAAILVTTATTNAAAISNISISYTNSAGTSGRTASTVRTFPANAPLGTIVWFGLQSGDVGIESIQSCTIGTSLVTGAVSLILARPLLYCPVALANVAFTTTLPDGAPLRIENDAAIYVISNPTSTTSVNIQGNLVVSQL